MTTTQEVAPTSQELEDAFQECRRTYTGTGMCFAPDYLEARRKYHALLVKAGILHSKLVDK
jgi:hypothetical protein